MASGDIKVTISTEAAVQVIMGQQKEILDKMISLEGRIDVLEGTTDDKPARKYTNVGDNAGNIPDIEIKRQDIIDDADSVLTVQDAAFFLKLSKTTINRLLQQDSIRGSKVGSQWRFTKQALLDWINDGMSKSTGQGKQMELSKEGQ